MPQLFHITWPSSRWKESTVRLPLIPRNFCTREAVAASLGVRAGDVVFTSGGTEADNLALFGEARFHRALTTIWEVIADANRYVDAQAPFMQT